MAFLAWSEPSVGTRIFFIMSLHPVFLEFLRPISQNLILAFREETPPIKANAQNKFKGIAGLICSLGQGRSQNSLGTVNQLPHRHHYPGVEKRGRISLPGFGPCSVGSCKANTGINSQTGREIKIMVYKRRSSSQGGYRKRRSGEIFGVLTDSPSTLLRDKVPLPLTGFHIRPRATMSPRATEKTPCPLVG